MSYEQTILRRIRDQFSKDEAVGELLQRLPKLATENGVLLSENAELKDSLEKALSKYKKLDAELSRANRQTKLQRKHTQLEAMFQKKCNALMDLETRHLNMVIEYNKLKQATGNN